MPLTMGFYANLTPGDKHLYYKENKGSGSYTAGGTWIQGVLGINVVLFMDNHENMYLNPFTAKYSLIDNTFL